jgi:hypothetical protein
MFSIQTDILRSTHAVPEDHSVDEFTDSDFYVSFSTIIMAKIRLLVVHHSLWADQITVL